MQNKNQIKFQNKKIDFSAYLSNSISKGVKATLDTIKNEINKNTCLLLKEGNYNYNFIPIDVKHNSDDYYIISGHLKDKTNIYDVYIKIKHFKLFKCFVKGDDFNLNIDKIYLN